MGTRADFYVGTGPKAEWIGSLDHGYIRELDHTGLFTVKTVGAFRKKVNEIIENRGGTKKAEGWPWPWDDSTTTDYSYAFSKGKVLASSWGRAWFDPLKSDTGNVTAKEVKFPFRGGSHAVIKQSARTRRARNKR